MNLKLDFKKVFSDFIAVKIRKEKTVDWIGSLLAPIQTLNDEFAAWYSNLRYELSFTGQQIYLEHLLNDAYDNSARRIFIDDPAGTVIFSQFVFNKREGQPSFFIYNKSEATGSDFIYNKSEASTSTDDFIVHVPSTIFNPSVQLSMSRLLDRYRAVGKKYSFQTF